MVNNVTNIIDGATTTTKPRNLRAKQNHRAVRTIEGFHVMSQQPNRASHAIHSRHVGSFFALSGIGKSHKIIA